MLKEGNGRIFFSCSQPFGDSANLLLANFLDFFKFQFVFILFSKTRRVLVFDLFPVRKRCDSIIF